jgi:hypothetical protein
VGKLEGRTGNAALVNQLLDRLVHSLAQARDMAVLINRLVPDNQPI